ncbi:hypothetical protein KP509_04G055500 [Ceratopteris richardii]|uniref:Uncharacterized protein n=1 Tax=Ceratopteris richardii TaxID=49495 RepID=A0A8T2V0J6_CERRI|nr:hypothetical protein KP509_04G055500 [Ceratopteris richardii]
MDEEAPSGGSNTSKKSKGGNSEVGVPGNGSLALISKILENAMQDASTDPGKETAHKRRGAAGEQEEEGKDDEEEGKESDMEEKGNDDELLQGEQGQRTVRGRSIAAEALDVGREEDDRMSQERGDEEVKEEKSESFGVGATTVHGPSADKDASECSPSLSTVEEYVTSSLTLSISYIRLYSVICSSYMSECG